jgi:hypothetical protein
MEKIIFTHMESLDLEEEFPPIPAHLDLPEWYKKLESYLGGKKAPDGQGGTLASIKKCMPVFDMITSGYVIRSSADVWVSQKPVVDSLTSKPTGKTVPWYEWPSKGMIQFHPISQAPTHPNNTGHEESYPKWMSPWGITTPPGYSCLFMQPSHRESVFTILPGVVDTDSYVAPINFPFVLNDITFEGLIPAGTPIAQIIPFKRNSWKMEFGKEKEFKKLQQVKVNIRTNFFDIYKTKHRSIKVYK